MDTKCPPLSRRMYDEIYINWGQIPSHESSLGNELKYSLNRLMCAFLQIGLSWLPEQIKYWPQPAAVIQKEKEEKRCMKIPIRTTVQQMQTAVQGDGTGLQGLGHSATDMESSAMSLYKEFFHQTPPFRLPPSHTGRTTGALWPLCPWGWDFSWNWEGLSFHLHYSSHVTHNSFIIFSQIHIFNSVSLRNPIHWEYYYYAI